MASFDRNILHDVLFLDITPSVGEVKVWKDAKGNELGKGPVIYAGTDFGGICLERSKENCEGCPETLCRVEKL